MPQLLMPAGAPTGSLPVSPDLGSFDPEAIWRDAKKILETIGVAIQSEVAAKRLQGQVRLQGSRAYLAPELVQHYADELIAKFRAGSGEPFPWLTPEVSSWHNCFRDPETGDTKPWTTDALRQHTKALYKMFEERKALYVHTPGYPQDVSPALAPLEAQYIEFLYSPHPELKMVQGIEAHQLRIELSQAMGMHHGFAAQTISPLKFGGHTVDIVFELWEPGFSVLIDTMPVVGISAPADWHSAWALDVAENVAAYTLFRLCGIDDVWTQFRLFPPNMNSGLLWFSSPKHLSAMLMRRKIREFFGIAETRRSEFMLVVSKAPDQQAAAEKMAGLMAGAIWGFDVIEGAGGLYLDEVFSWEQFWVDMELRDYVASMFQAVPLRNRSTDDVLRTVKEGVDAGGYFETDLTLFGYKDFSWHPKMFDITARQAWDGHGFLDKGRYPDLTEMADAYQPELSGEKREAVERIMARARLVLG